MPILPWRRGPTPASRELPTGRHKDLDLAGLAGAGAHLSQATPWTRMRSRANASLLREWAETNEWVRAAINARRSQVATARWDIQPIDPARPHDLALRERLLTLLHQPNARRDSYRTLIEPVLEDYLVLGKGCMEKELDAAGRPVALYALDAARVGIDPRWDGSGPAQPRYWYETGTGQRLPLRDSECIVVVASPSTYRAEGLSAVEVLRRAIEADLAAGAFQDQMLRQEPPAGWFHFRGASQTQVDAARDRYEGEVAGKKAVFFTGGNADASYHALMYNSRDLQMMEYQTYQVRKICAVFGISPQQLGVTFDINRATAEVQADITRDTGLTPLLTLFEQHINREIVGEWGTPLAINLRFVYTQLTETDRRDTAELLKLQGAGMPYLTLNELRLEDGREALAGGDRIFLPTASGAVALELERSTE